MKFKFGRTAFGLGLLNCVFILLSAKYNAGIMIFVPFGVALYFFILSGFYEW